MNVGDQVKVRRRTPTGRTTANYDGKFWHSAEVVAVSECRRYARIRGKPSWCDKTHEALLPVELLALLKTQNQNTK